MELKSKTIKAVKWTFLSTAVGALVTVVQLWALSHILSPHEYGIIGASLIIIQFFNIFVDFGLSNSIIRRMSISDLELSSLFCISLFLGVTNFILVYFSSEWFGVFFKSDDVVLQIKIMSVTFLISAFGQQQRALLARELRFNTISIISIIVILTNFFSVIGLALIYEKAWVASVAAVLSAAAGCSIFFIHGLREREFSLKFSWAAARPHIAYSVALVSDSIINVISINTFPLLMGRLLNLTAIGGYNIANGISVNLIERLKPMLTQALFPALAKLQGNDEKLASNFLLITTYSSLINFPLLVGISITSTALVTVFFGPEWWFIDVLVKILCIAGMFRSLDAPVISLLLVKAKMHLNVRLGIPKLLVGIALAYQLGIKYGITGIVISFLLVQAANTIVGYFYMVRSCLPGIGKAYCLAILIPLLQIFPLLFVSGLLTLFPLVSSMIVNLVIVVVLGILSYILGLYFSPFASVRGFISLAVHSVSPKLERFLQLDKK